jgi:hypothetical protein
VSFSFGFVHRSLTKTNRKQATQTAMKGNRYGSDADPMKSRRQRQRDTKAKREAKDPRRRRLKRRLQRVDNFQKKQQKHAHVTALMESYALRRQKERRQQRKEEAKKAKGEQQQQSAPQKPQQKQQQPRSQKPVANTVRK